MIKFKNLMKDFGILEINFKKLIEPKIIPEIPVEPKMNETSGLLSNTWNCSSTQESEQLVMPGGWGSYLKYETINRF